MEDLKLQLFKDASSKHLSDGGRQAGQILSLTNGKSNICHSNEIQLKLRA